MPITQTKQRLNFLPEIKSIVERRVDSFVFKSRDNPGKIFNRDYEQLKHVI